MRNGRPPFTIPEEDEDPWPRDDTPKRSDPRCPLNRWLRQKASQLELSPAAPQSVVWPRLKQEVLALREANNTLRRTMRSQLKQHFSQLLEAVNQGVLPLAGAVKDHARRLQDDSLQYQRLARANTEELERCQLQLKGEASQLQQQRKKTQELTQRVKRVEFQLAGARQQLAEQQSQSLELKIGQQKLKDQVATLRSQLQAYSQREGQLLQELNRLALVQGRNQYLQSLLEEQGQAREESQQRARRLSLRVESLQGQLESLAQSHQQWLESAEQVELLERQLDQCKNFQQQAIAANTQLMQMLALGREESRGLRTQLEQQEGSIRQLCVEVRYLKDCEVKTQQLNEARTRQLLAQAEQQHQLALAELTQRLKKEELQWRTRYEQQKLTSEEATQARETALSEVSKLRQQATQLQLQHREKQRLLQQLQQLGQQRDRAQQNQKEARQRLAQQQGRLTASEFERILIGVAKRVSALGDSLAEFKYDKPAESHELSQYSQVEHACTREFASARLQMLAKLDAAGERQKELSRQVEALKTQQTIHAGEKEEAAKNGLALQLLRRKNESIADDLREKEAQIKARNQMLGHLRNQLAAKSREVSQCQTQLQQGRQELDQTQSQLQARLKENKLLFSLAQELQSRLADYRQKEKAIEQLRAKVVRLERQQARSLPLEKEFHDDHSIKEDYMRQLKAEYTRKFRSLMDQG